MQLSTSNADLIATYAIPPTVSYWHNLWLPRQPSADRASHSTLTHTDLNVDVPVQTFLSDLEGDTTFYRITGATHGTATLSGNGKFVIFRPDAATPAQRRSRLLRMTAMRSRQKRLLRLNVSSAQLLRLNSRASAHSPWLGRQAQHPG